MGASEAASRRRARVLRRIASLDVPPREVRTLPELAEAVNAAERTLQRHLAPQGGFTGWRLRYMARWSLKELLAGRTVGEVALETGYGSPPAYSTAFKNAMGISPVQAKSAVQAIWWLDRRGWHAVPVAVPRGEPRRPLGLYWSRADARHATTLLDVWHRGDLTAFGERQLGRLMSTSMLQWLGDARFRVWDSPHQIAIEDGWIDQDGCMMSLGDRTIRWLIAPPAGDAALPLDTARRRAAGSLRSPRIREAVLRTFDGQSPEEIALAQGISVKRATGRIGRGLARLAGVVEADFAAWAASEEWRSPDAPNSSDAAEVTARAA